jgi:hypothetical protein
VPTAIEGRIQVEKQHRMITGDRRLLAPSWGKSSSKVALLFTKIAGPVAGPDRVDDNERPIRPSGR